MMLDHRQHHLEGIRKAVSVLVYPLQAVVNLPSSASDWAGEKLSSRQTLLIENANLRTQQAMLLARLQKINALEVENDRLRELLQSSKKVGENVLIGELMAVALEPFTRKIIINKGLNDKVYVGQPLLDAGGIMGQIIHVGPFSSTAMLITDPNHAIPVQVNRNGLRAIVVGTGSTEQMEIPYLPNSADIKIGDLLTSSGLGGRFPPDYPVAEVTAVYKDPSQPYAVVYAKPSGNLERSREVLLVWRSDQEKAPPTAKPMEQVGDEELARDLNIMETQQAEIKPDSKPVELLRPEEQETESVAPPDEIKPATPLPAKPKSKPNFSNTAAPSSNSNVTAPVTKIPAHPAPPAMEESTEEEESR